MYQKSHDRFSLIPVAHLETTQCYHFTVLLAIALCNTNMYAWQRADDSDSPVCVLSLASRIGVWYPINHGYEYIGSINS